MSVSIQILTGKYAGGTRKVSSDEPPEVALRDFAGKDVRLKIDHEESTVGEWKHWEMCYMIYRIVESLNRGRSVRLDYFDSDGEKAHREWKKGWFTSARKTLSDILHSIEITELNPYLEADDDSGVAIRLSDSWVPERDSSDI